MHKSLLLATLLLGCTWLSGQTSDYSICDCCTYALYNNENDFVDIFVPSLIKANHIKELTIFTTSKQRKDDIDTTYQIIDHEYRESIFRFNNDGYVISHILFNRRGQYHSIYDYIRDNDNKILSSTFHYLNNSGEISDLSVEKVIYQYQNGQLVKIKNLDYNLVEQPDSISIYSKFDYDSLGRIIKIISHYYFDPEMIYNNLLLIKFNDTLHTAVETFESNGDLIITYNRAYTPDNKLLSVMSYNNKNIMLDQQLYAYNEIGQLIKFEINTYDMATECPDRGNFMNTYSYSTNKLISSITHQYKNTICAMRFVYY